VAAPKNPKTLPARLAKRRKAQDPGTVKRLKAALWLAISRLQEELEDKTRPLETRFIHALAQVAPAYLKAVEVGELEARLFAIENSLSNGSAHGLKPIPNTVDTNTQEVDL
jgi:hypothetical protein